MKTIHRLDRGLRLWEDTCLFASVEARRSQLAGERPPTLPFTGPFRYWQEFRNSLIRNEDFSRAKFTGDKKLFHSTLGWTWSLPLHLWSWTHNSRRVFHITKELQLLLEATSLGDVRWSDIQLPFHSFVITLELPIEDKGEPLYDCMMVSQYRTVNEDSTAVLPNTFCSVLVLSKDLEERKLLSNNQRDNLTRLCNRREWAKLSKQIAEHQDTVWPRATVFSLDLDSIQNSLVTESTVNLVNQSPHTTPYAKDAEAHLSQDMSLRLLAGLCLYLEGLGSVSPHKSDWRRLAKTDRLDRNAISNPAQVCAVSLDYNLLTPEEREVLSTDPGARRAYKEMGFHWRRKHKRRPPGQGKNPAAPKTVPVPAYRVRIDRRLEETIAGGSEQRLKVS